MTTSIGEQLQEKVREIAAERPDYVYKGKGGGVGKPGRCVYVRDGQPSCLIGHALWGLGLIDATLEQRGSGQGFNTGDIHSLADTLKLDIDSDSLDWLSHAQYRQDVGNTWGDAVQLADEQLLPG